MAAINTPLLAREASEVMNQLAKRKSWPAKNVGVMVVFCIVFVVAAALLGLCISKALTKRKERQQPKY